MVARGNFNSIKVRLELDKLILSLPFFGFQFHKGAIRTLPSTAVLGEKPNFNSIKVRLERSVFIPYNISR